MRSTVSLSVYVLTALAEGDAYGSLIGQQMAKDSPTVFVSDNQLYATLKRLEGHKLIALAPTSTPRRRIYALTPKGRRFLKREQVRLQDLAHLLRQRLP